MRLPASTLALLREFSKETGISRHHDALAAVFAINGACIRDTEAGPRERLVYQQADGKNELDVVELMACHMSLARNLRNTCRNSWRDAAVDPHEVKSVIDYMRAKGIYASDSKPEEVVTAAITLALNMFRTYGSPATGKMAIPAVYPPEFPQARVRHIYLRPTS